MHFCIYSFISFSFLNFEETGGFLDSFLSVELLSLGATDGIQLNSFSISASLFLSPINNNLIGDIFILYSPHILSSFF